MVLIASMIGAPTFKQIFQSIWSMTCDLLRHAPLQILIALFILVAAEAAKASLPADNQVLQALIEVTQSILLVPFCFALYRRLLLSEPPRGYYFDLTSLRVRQFSIWTLVFMSLSVAPLFVATTVDFGGANAFVVLATIAYMAAIIYLMIRLALLLPAFAAGRDGVSWRDAWADSRGHFWSLIKILLSAVVFALVIIVPANVAIGYTDFDSTADLSDWRRWTRAVFDGVMGVVVMLPIGAAGALSFIWIGDRVKHSV